MYSISVSKIEKFRRFMEEVTEADNEKNLIAAITGKTKQTNNMKLGAALHNIIDHPASCIQEMGGGKWWLISEGVAIPQDQADKLINFRKQLPGVITEVPIGKEYQTPYGPVAVSGRVDGLIGAIVRDAKFRFSDMEYYDEFMNSSQWKWYLDMWGLRQFVYDVFEIKAFKKLVKSPEGIYYPDKLAIYSRPSVECYAYAGMREELQALLNEFMHWLSRKSLLNVLKQVETAQKDVRIHV